MSFVLSIGPKTKHNGRRSPEKQGSQWHNDAHLHRFAGGCGKDDGPAQAKHPQTERTVKVLALVDME